MKISKVSSKANYLHYRDVFPGADDVFHNDRYHPDVHLCRGR